jgi:hypothetical protein
LLREPLRQIVTNAGDEASVVVAEVARGTGNFGYNAASPQPSSVFGYFYGNRYCEMV